MKKIEIVILKKFINYLLINKNYSSNTAKAYYKDLKLFFEFIKSYLNWNIDINDINVFLLSTVEENVIYSFMVYLNIYKNNSSSSRKRKLSSIKSFYKWLFIKYYNLLKDKKNPTANISKIQSTERLPKYLSLEDAKKLQFVFNNTNSKFALRDNTIIILFLNCGLRISELINCDVSDLDLENKTLNVLGKGNKQRIIYLNDYVVNQLEKYLETRKDDYKPLFLNNRNERLRISVVTNICKKAFEITGLEEYQYTTHSLRHTAATLLYKYGKVDIRIIQEFLGHETITSTEIYTHVNNEQIRNAVNSNPLSNFKVKIGEKGEK